MDHVTVARHTNTRPWAASRSISPVASNTSKLTAQPQKENMHRNFPKRMTHGLSRTSPFRLGLIALFAVVIRIILYYDFPIFLTNDSWDYIAAAGDIYHHADFNSAALRDLRLPGYPVLLALTYPLTGMQSSNIVLLQKGIGLACVALGLAIGFLLHSRRVAEVLALFLGLNPVYLLNEHALMTETFSLFTLLGFLVIVLVCLHGRLTWLKGAALGLALGICVLIRTNALPFCATLIVGIVAVRLIQHKSSIHLAATRRNLLGYIVALCATAVLVMSPWLWRNYTLFGHVAFVNSANRVLLNFKFLHRRLDTALPRISEVNRLLSKTEVDYDWLWNLNHAFSSNEADRIAGEILQEQIVNHPGQHVHDVLYSFLGFGGFYEAYGNDRAATLIWFDYLVRNVPLLHKNNTRPGFADFTYIANGSDTPITQVWSKMGVAFLVAVRPLLYTAFFVVVILYMRPRLRIMFATDELTTLTPILCAAAYVVTVMVHTLTLTDSDRYAVIFDWLPLLVILLIVEQFLKDRRSQKGDSTPR